MSSTLDRDRLANEAAAVADALAALRFELSRKLTYTDEIPPEVVPAVQTVVGEGQHVIIALGRLSAGLMADLPDKKGSP
jgi:hypothetical protein